MDRKDERRGGRPPNRAMKKAKGTPGRKPDAMPDMWKVGGNAAEFVSRHIEGLFSAPKAEQPELIKRALVQAASASDEQKRQQVALAYGLTVTHGHDSEALNHFRMVSNAKKGALPVRVFLGALINYDDGYRTPKQISGAYSRDVRAVKYAIAHDIQPEQFAEKAAKPGEGLDVWAKEWSKSQSAVKKPRAAKSERPTGLLKVRFTVEGRRDLSFSADLEEEIVNYIVEGLRE